MTVTASTTEAWPALPLAAWRETQETLHLWTQVVGKVKLELSPFSTSGGTSPSRSRRAG